MKRHPVVTEGHPKGGGRDARTRNRKCPSGALWDVCVYRFLFLVICPFPAILFSWGMPSIITFLTKVCCLRICSRLLCSTPSSLSRPRSHCGISTKKPKSQMNEMVTLIPTCIVSSKNYSRMILLNSEKQCIYMYRGRRRRRRLAGRSVQRRRAD